MVSEGFTVSEIASRLGARSERQADLWLRRLRHWSTLGILDTLGPQHSGSGRHRRYETETIYIAALLVRLADRGLPVGVLKLIAGGLARSTSPQGEYHEQWETAKSSASADRLKGPVYITFSFEPDDESALTTDEILVQMNHGVGMLSPQFYSENDIMEIVNVSQIFSRVTP